ncbi:MAG: Uma2 family endonuclease [Chloroflexota bacterium]
MSLVNQTLAYTETAHKNGDQMDHQQTAKPADIAKTLVNFNAIKQKRSPNGDTSLITNAPNEDPYYYGWRYIADNEQSNGKTIWRKVPLTQADFLNPQLGDKMVQGHKHFLLVNSIFDRFSNRHINDDTIGIFSDLIFSWGIAGVSNPAPDLAVVPGVRNKQGHRGSFNVRREGASPCLVVEVVSPRYPGDDTDKVEIYRRAGVQEYIIINAHFDNDAADWELIGYHLDPSQPDYVPMITDSQGRLYSRTTNTYWSIDDEYENVIIVDGNTGEPLLDGSGEHLARMVLEQSYAEAEEARTEAEEARAAAEAENQRLMAYLRSIGVDPADIP